MSDDVTIPREMAKEIAKVLRFDAPALMPDRLRLADLLDPPHVEGPINPSARERLERLSTSADVHEGMPADRMRNALLAVLDECDRLDGEDDDYYPTLWYDALAHAADRIHAAVDRTLGISDE